MMFFFKTYFYSCITEKNDHVVCLFVVSLHISVMKSSVTMQGLFCYVFSISVITILICDVFKRLLSYIFNEYQVSQV